MSKMSSKRRKAYVLDTNVLIHDPTSILNFEENQVIIPITVLEELDQLKSSKHAYAADCRSAIRMIDAVIGNASPEQISIGVPIYRDNNGQASGSLSVLMTSRVKNDANSRLPNDLNDNKIINRLIEWQEERKETKVVLVTKDINMRLKARSCGLESEDYQNDQLLSDIKQLTKGYKHIPGSFWDMVENVNSTRVDNKTFHTMAKPALDFDVYTNEFIVDEAGFVGRFKQVNEDTVTILDLSHHGLLERQAWGLKPRNIYQALALNLLLDPEVHLVTLTGAAGSGKTILALAAALEMTVENKLYNKIIVTRSTPPLAEEHGFLPGTEEEKMDP